MFSEIAPRYDFLNHLFSAGIDRHWRRFAARRLVRADTQRILDVCAGTGDLALAFHHRARRMKIAPPVIVASDFTSAMMRLAQPKFARAAPSGVWSSEKSENDEAPATTRPLASVADTLALPFPANTFDLVAVAFGIRNVSSRDHAFAEMVRVCRPGGTIAVLEFSRMRARGLSPLFDWYFNRMLPTIGNVLTRSRAYRYLADSVGEFPDTEEFLAELSIAAGTSATARRLSGGIASLYAAQIRKA